jgi:hypothetical protein
VCEKAQAKVWAASPVPFKEEPLNQVLLLQFEDQRPYAMDQERVFIITIVDMNAVPSPLI